MSLKMDKIYDYYKYFSLVNPESSKSLFQEIGKILELCPLLPKTNSDARNPDNPT